MSPEALRRRWLVTAVVTGAALAGTAPPSAAQSARTPDVIPGSYIVGYETATAQPGAKTDRLERAKGFKARLRFGRALKGFSARLSPKQVDDLRADPDVAFVTPDRRVRASAAVPLASGDAAPSGVRRIAAATATSARQASTVNVAVIDSGIDLSHPDLRAVDGTNCVTRGAPAQDDDGHGTHVAGTIAARNDGSGVVGVAPDTRVWAVKVLAADGGGSWSQVICGIDWVTATRSDADPANDIAVANMSLGGAGQPVGSCSSTTDPLHRAVCASTAAGVTYVVAAGNDGWDFDYASAPDVPAAYPQVLTVTAVTDSDGVGGATGDAPACSPVERDDRYASFSNFAGTTAGAAHTIAAPGTCITSTWPGGGHSTISGTSMAAPHVAGVVALCLGEDGAAGPCAGMTPAQIVAKLRSEAESRTRATSTYGFAGDPLQPAGASVFGYLTAGVVAAAPPAPAPASVTAAPSSAVLYSGALRSGNAGRLADDDDLVLTIDSTTSGTRLTDWYGRFTGVSNAITALKTRYRGRASASCSQTVHLYNWTDGRWEQVAAGTAGTVEREVAASAGGALARFVSGGAGDGDVAVRVRCARGDGLRFSTSADLLRIEYAR